MLRSSEFWPVVLFRFSPTWFACGVMSVLSAVNVHRRRRIGSDVPVQSTARALAFYWPVYVWGIQAPFGFMSNLVGCGPGPSTDADFINLSRMSWVFVFESAVVVCLVVALAATVQYTSIRLLPNPHGATVGVPLPVVAVVVGVLGLQAALNVLVLKFAPGAET